MLRYVDFMSKWNSLFSDIRRAQELEVVAVGPRYTLGRLEAISGLFSYYFGTV